MTQRDPAPDSVLLDLLAAVQGFPPAGPRALAALEGGPGPEAWATAVQALDDALAALEAPLGGSLLAAGLAGAWRTGERVPAEYSVPPDTPPPAAPPPANVARLRATYESLPEADRPAWLAALPPAVARQIARRAEVIDPSVGEALAAVEPPAATLPMIERAASGLLARGIYRPETLRREAERAKDDAGEAVRQARRDAIGVLHDAATEAARAGGSSLPAFRAAVREKLGDEGEKLLPPRRVEAAFRTAVMQSYSEGVDRVLADPLAGPSFPYEETLPIEDSRLTELCAIVSRSGIQGTAIFRSDDPTWEKLKPPRHYNCRCGRSPITLREAASRGIEEAVEWLRTGREPSPPAWVPMPELPKKGGKE